MLRSSLAAVLATAALGLAGNACAATLVLQNANFEADQYAEGAYRISTYGGGPQSWKGGGQFSATWNPTATSYTDQASHGTVASIYGGSISNDAQFGAATGIQQTVGGYKIEKNTRYTLSFDVGNRSDVTDPGGFAFGLIAGDGIGGAGRDLVIASLSDMLSVVQEGTFKTFTLTFETGADDAFIGKLLTVGFGGNGTRTYGAEFDNAVLTAEALSVSGVPEPSVWALMITGFGLAGSALRRRRAALAI